MTIELPLNQLGCLFDSCESIHTASDVVCLLSDTVLSPSSHFPVTFQIIPLVSYYAKSVVNKCIV